MDPQTYMQQVVQNAGKGAAPTDAEIMMNHARQAFASGDQATGTVLARQAYKLGYIEPINVRPGGAVLDPITNQPVFVNPQLEKGMVAQFGSNGLPQSASVLPGFAEGNAAIEAAEKGAVAKVQSNYQLQPVFDPSTNQTKFVPVSTILGGTPNPSGSPAGNAPGKYVPGAGSQTSGGFAAGPPLGAAQAANTLGDLNAKAFQSVQDLATQSRQQIQALRNMEGLVNSGLKTGPSRAKFQEWGEEWGFGPFTQDNAFVFNKNQARFVAQSMQNLGLTGTDARMGLVNTATPGLKMPASALHQIIPEMIGLAMANAAKADANQYWIAHNPQGIMSQPQFETWWRQNYDPRIFTAIARGPAAFKAQIQRLPPKDQQFYMSKYYALRNMGVNFAQFNQ